MSQNKTQNKKVLLVDDSITVIKLLERFFQEEGFITETAFDGIEAIKKAYQFLPDIIILDFVMPQLGGLSTCRFFRQKEIFSKVPIIILSTVEDKDKINWAQASGANLFISKNKPPTNLISEVKRLVQLYPQTYDIPPREVNEEEIVNEIFNLFEKQHTSTIFLDEIAQLSVYLDDIHSMAKRLLRILYFNFPSFFIYLKITTPTEKLQFLISPKEKEREIETILNDKFGENINFIYEEENITLDTPYLYYLPLSFSKLTDTKASLTFCFNRKNQNILEKSPFFNILTKHLSILLEYAIYHRNLEKKSYQNIIKLETIIEISKFLDDSVKEEELLEKIVTGIKKMMECEKVTFFLINPLLKKAVLKAQSGAHKYIDEFSIRENSVTDWVLKNKKPLLMEDTRQNEELNLTYQREKGSFICAPILNKNNLIGTLNITNKIDGSSFVKTDLELVMALSKIIGMILENRFLSKSLQANTLENDRKNWEIKTLISLIKATNSIENIPQIIILAEEQLKQLLEAAEVIFIYYREKLVFSFRPLSPSKEEKIKKIIEETPDKKQLSNKEFLFYSKNKESYLFAFKENGKFRELDLETLKTFYHFLALIGNQEKLLSLAQVDPITGFSSLAKFREDIKKQIDSSDNKKILQIKLMNSQHKEFLANLLLEIPHPNLIATKLPFIWIFYQKEDSLEKAIDKLSSPFFENKLEYQQIPFQKFIQNETY